MNDKTPIDVTAGVIAFGAIIEWLPAVASLLTIVWMSLRIYQTVYEIKNRNK
tara:strand:+ start:51 stop:206 length:156 start_codon:yes stop_codon:yes gene_type:complete